MTNESKSGEEQRAPLWPVEVTAILALFLGSLAYGAVSNGWTYAFLIVAAAGAVITAAALQTVKWWMRRERSGSAGGVNGGATPPHLRRRAPQRM